MKKKLTAISAKIKKLKTGKASANPMSKSLVSSGLKHSSTLEKLVQSLQKDEIDENTKADAPPRTPT